MFGQSTGDVEAVGIPGRHSAFVAPRTDLAERLAEAVRIGSCGDGRVFTRSHEVRVDERIGLVREQRQPDPVDVRRLPATDSCGADQASGPTPS